MSVWSDRACGHPASSSASAAVGKPRLLNRRARTQTNDPWTPGLPPLPQTCSVPVVYDKKASRVVELAGSETHEEMAMTSNDRNDQGSKTWQLDVSIDEHEKRTGAKVRLSWRGIELVGAGLARLNPDDEPVVEIGDELAVARALSDLANQLFALTASDIEASTHKPPPPRQQAW